MRQASGRQASRGGGELATYEWHPDGPSRAAVVLVHGLAEHAGRYHKLVERLTGAAYSVHALDLRGHGRSDGPRAQVGRFAWLVEDVAARIAAARASQPGLPVVLLGHSMGGAIALATALEFPAGLTALVLSAPAIAADPAVPALRVAVARLLSRAWPGAGVLRLEARWVSRDASVVRAYESDPLVYRGSIPARTAVELLGAMAAFPARVGGLRLPTLVLHGTADRLVPLPFVEPLLARLGTPDLAVHRYEGLYHEVFNEPEQDRVCADLLAWLARAA